MSLFWGDSSGSPSAPGLELLLVLLLPSHSHLATHSCTSQALLALRAHGTSWKLSWLMRESTTNSRAGAGEAGEAQSQEQAQPWHSWAPLNCSASMTCRKRLQPATGWPQQCVQSPGLAGWRAKKDSRVSALTALWSSGPIWLLMSHLWAYMWNSRAAVVLIGKELIQLWKPVFVEMLLWFGKVYCSGK